jgi:hypothetical protein
VKKRDLPLAEWLLVRRANPNTTPARAKRFPKCSLYELALMKSLPEMAELLARHGAAHVTPALDETERFIDATLRLDPEGAHALLVAHPDYMASLVNLRSSSDS